jgi:S-DNA-T family DNA segregation ATPase FtsK/SpoIIIE
MPTRTKAKPNKAPTAATIPAWLKDPAIWGLVLMGVGLLVCLAVFSGGQGFLGGPISLHLRRALGVGAFPAALLILGAGVYVYVRQVLALAWKVRWRAVIGGELTLLALLGLVHVLSPAEPNSLALSGGGGGWVGWALYQLLVPLLGKAVTLVLLLPLLIWGVQLMVPLPWRLIGWRLHWAWARLGATIRDRINRRRYFAARAASQPIAVHVETAARPLPAIRAAPKDRVRKASPARKPSAAAAPAPSAASLPSLELLAPYENGDGDEAETRYQAEVIEQTLAAFGVPATVVEWNHGPVVTQYGLEPGYVERQDHEGNTSRHKVRVNKILSLHNDLALALAAAPIRIEAPIPGRGLVGIEVPNRHKSMVGLRGVLQSPAFERMRSNLRIGLGRGVSGEPVVADLARMPHLLIAGATGTGKSVCLNAIIASLLFQNTPEQLRLLMVDPKRVELTRFNGLPHLLSPALTETEKVILSLRWVLREMDARYKGFAAAGVRDLRGYNRRAKARHEEQKPNIVVLVDELADLMLVAADEVERIVCRLAQMARATGIHLVIATQRPSVDVVTGLIKANFPARISFAVTSQVDSRVVLDTPGAEKLLGRGDMLFMQPDSAKLLRVQGSWVSDQEVRALVRHWMLAGTAQPQVADQSESPTPEAPPWEGMATEAGEEDDDGLLAQAVEIVRDKQQASASFLQRQLRVGYPRAARLIDQLEEMGVVGPVGTGGRSRMVIPAGEKAEPSAGPR